MRIIKYFLLSLIIYFLSLQFLKFIESRKGYRLWIRILGAVGITTACALIIFYPILNFEKRENFVINIITALLLWLTWLGALWAAREAFDQKQIANKTIKEYRKQLEIEQEPYVVIAYRINIQGIESGGNKAKNYLKVRIRNIGRGPAIRITVNKSPSNPDEAFLNKNEPHSVDLASNSEKFGLIIDEGAMKKIILKKNGSFRDEKTPLVLFIHFRNQLDGRRRIRVKLKRVGGFLQVMEHDLKNTPIKKSRAKNKQGKSNA